MDYAGITNKYYANWLDVPCNVMYQDGISPVKSGQRAVCQKGYSTKFDLYVFVQNERIIISYYDKTGSHLDALLKDVKAGDKPEYVFNVIKDIYGITPNNYIKFVFHHLAHSNAPVKELTINDYPLYLQFFITNNPKCKNTDWLHEYFLEIAKKRYVYGIIIDKLLVAATDAPSMPYMETEVQEIGVNTLNEYRGKGYAKAVCITAINSLLRQNICPLWSTKAGNTASERLAYSIGFKKLADVIAVSFS
jgi:RimJ/RimL family protein N-acetyltransferase